MRTPNFRGKKPLLQYVLMGLVCVICVACSHKGSSVQTKPVPATPKENQQVSEATAKRVAAELEAHKKSGTASPELIKDYETYLKRVQAITDENRRVVREMEAAYARHHPQKKYVKTPGSKDMDATFNSTLKKEQTEDEVVVLERELNRSMAEFDEMLLKELETIREESDNRMRDLTREADAAAQRLRERGFEFETSQSGVSNGDSERGHDFKNDGGQTKGMDPEVSHKKGQRTTEKQRGYPTNDDIVARQLREAAESETDPKLKEKLWKEYEDYKKNARAK